jgi:predicted HicB family RNase H-like nuclease
MTTDANAYAVSIFRTEIDGENVIEARVSELPGIVGYGDTAAEAHAMVIEAIEKLAEMAEADGERLPDPTPRESRYSGRVTLRMSQTLHRLARVTADREGVTLNALLCDRLAVSLGMTAASFLAPSRPQHIYVQELGTPASLLTVVHLHGQIGIMRGVERGDDIPYFTTETAASSPTMPVRSGDLLSLASSDSEAELA